MRQKIIILGIFLSIFLSGLSLQNTIVSAQYTPDSGFKNIERTVNYQVYSAGSAMMSGDDSVSWYTVWTKTSGTGISYLNNVWKTGWQKETEYKQNLRNIFWFDTHNLSDISISSAYLTISSYHSGKAVDKLNFYCLQYSDQSPPIDNNNYRRTSATYPSGFNGNSTNRVLTVQNSNIVTTGFTCFQFMSYPDIIGDITFYPDAGDRCTMTITSIILTVVYSVQPPAVVFATPREIVTTPNPELKADVKANGGGLIGNAYLYSGATGTWVLKKTISLSYYETKMIQFQEVNANTTGTYAWRISCNLVLYPTTWQNFSFQYTVSDATVNASITARSYTVIEGGSIIYDAVCPLASTNYSAHLYQVAPGTKLYYSNFTSRSDHTYSGTFSNLMAGNYTLTLYQGVTLVKVCPTLVRVYISGSMNSYTLSVDKSKIKPGETITLSWTKTGTKSAKIGYLFENKEYGLTVLFSSVQIPINEVGTYTFYICDFTGSYGDSNAETVIVYCSETGTGGGYDDTGSLIVIGLVVVMCIGSVLALVLQTPFGFIIGASATAYILSLEALGDLQLLPTFVGYGLIVVLVLAGVIVWFLD